MDTQTLMTAQAEALATLVSLMRMAADDARPAHVINTIKQAAIAILRLKPLSRQGEDRSTRQRGSGEGGLRTPSPSAAHSPQVSNVSCAHANGELSAPADPTAHLTDHQFAQLLQHLPETLEPATEKRRLRLARYLARFNLAPTPEVKAAIIDRADRLAQSMIKQPRAA